MSSYQVRSTPGDTAWFRAARFGMFIHWGLYALPARHEWVKCYEKTQKRSTTGILSISIPTCMTPGNGRGQPKPRE